MDPLLGRWSDRLYRRALPLALQRGAWVALALASGFALLFFPWLRTPDALLVWALVCLVITYTAYSALAILHQAWECARGNLPEDQLSPAAQLWVDRIRKVMRS